MPRVNTRESRNLIATCSPFTSNGAITGYQDQAAYVVRSYATPLLVINQDEQTAYFNDTRYSVTTSRHQTECRMALVELERNGYQIEVVDNREEFETLTGYQVTRY